MRDHHRKTLNNIQYKLMGSFALQNKMKINLRYFFTYLKIFNIIKYSNGF